MLNIVKILQQEFFSISGTNVSVSLKEQCDKRSKQCPRRECFIKGLPCNMPQANLQLVQDASHEILKYPMTEIQTSGEQLENSFLS